MWYLLCLIPLLLFIPFWGDFIFLPGTSLSDITISHYPNLLFLQQSLRAGDGIPLWSPLILSGYPFVADPLSGLHYPPGWLALLFPLPFGINLSVALHLVFGAFGMYLFLKSQGLRPQVAALTGLGFAMLPKLIGHYAAGHLSLVYAISWTPWLLLAEVRWRENAGWVHLWRGPGVVLGLITLADPRWTVYSGFLWLAFSIKESFPGRTAFKRVLSFILNLVLQAILALALSAALLLPLLQYTALSTRASLTAADVLDLSLPWSGLVNLFFPTSGGNVEWIAYPGAVVFALVLTGLSSKVLRKPAGFWLWLALVAMILALGSGIPGMEIIAGIPGLSLLRIPARWMFIALINLVFAGGYILDGLLKLETGGRRVNLLALIGLNAAVLVFAIGGSLVAGKAVTELVFSAGGLLLVTILMLVYIKTKMTPRIFSLAVLAVLLLNLFSVDWYFTQGTSAQQILSQGGEVAAYLKSQPDPFRVYSPSYSLPQQTAADGQLQLADGVDPLQLASYWSFMLDASGVPPSEYSVTIPDFATGKPAVDNQPYVPDAIKLGLLNVCFVVSEFDLSADGLALIDQVGSTRIYENCLCQPRAWVEIGNGVTGNATITKYSPNRIVVKAAGPGTLVLSEVMYPGWQASVDGNLVTIKPHQDLLRSVELQPGLHEVVFNFKPLTAYIGAGISVAAILILTILLILGKVFRK